MFLDPPMLITFIQKNKVTEITGEEEDLLQEKQL